MDVAINKMGVRVAQFDAALRASAAGANIAGASAGPYGCVVHTLMTPSAEETTLIQEVASKHGVLVVTTDKAQIDADDVEVATITCASAQIVSDATVTYTVWRNGALWAAAASATVTAGVVTLELATDDAGSYLVEIKRDGAGNYETGYVVIEAVE